MTYQRESPIDGWQIAFADRRSLDWARPALAIEELAWLESSRRSSEAKSQSRAAMELAKTLVPDAIIHEVSGRPRFRKENASISLSHKQHWVAAATAEGPFRTGIDIEALGKNFDAALFATRALVDEERARLDEFGQAWNLDHAGSVLALWSLKECFYKAWGTTASPREVRFQPAGKSLICQAIAGGEWRDVPLRGIFLRANEGFLFVALLLPPPADVTARDAPAH